MAYCKYNNFTTSKPDLKNQSIIFQNNPFAIFLGQRETVIK